MVVVLPRVLSLFVFATALVVGAFGPSRAGAADALPPECSETASIVTCTYGFQGAEQSFAVPVGVSTVRVRAIGGRGGGVPAWGTGAPDEVEGDISVAGLSTLWVEVGGNGFIKTASGDDWSGGWNGGGAGSPQSGIGDDGYGGGGASDVRTCSRASAACILTGDVNDPRLLVAGGGGGGSSVSNGAGGAAGQDGQGNGHVGATPHGPGYTTRGRGATPNAAGAGGQGGVNGETGSPGQGGNAANWRGQGSGGGGGGFFGGGGGALEWAGNGSTEAYGGGGGGSSLVPAGGTRVHSGSSTPTIVITYVPDRTAPSVTLTTPTDGATYAQGQVVNAAYGCADEAGGSGLDTCIGTVPNGEPIDTSQPGTHSFTVTATDKAGNREAEDVSYTVAAAPPDNKSTIPQGQQEGLPSSDGQPATPTDTQLAPPRFALSHRRVLLTNGRVLIVLKCVGAPSTRCRGTLSLTPTSRTGRGRAAAAGTRVNIAGGRSATLKIKPSAKLRALIRKNRKTVVRATVRQVDGPTVERLVTIVRR